MYTRVDICTCDICKKRMSKPIWMKDYGSVTIIKESDESPITVEPLMFKDICAECRNSISKYILNSLYVEEKPEIEIKYDGEIIKEVYDNERIF